MNGLLPNTVTLQHAACKSTNSCQELSLQVLYNNTALAVWVPCLLTSALLNWYNGHLLTPCAQWTCMSCYHNVFSMQDMRILCLRYSACGVAMFRLASWMRSACWPDLAVMQELMRPGRSWKRSGKLNSISSRQRKQRRQAPVVEQLWWPGSSKLGGELGPARSSQGLDEGCSLAV